MNNQNLNIELDVTILNRAIKEGLIIPQVWKDKNGMEHSSVILFAKETRMPTEKKTHNLTAKASDSYKDAKDGEGNVIYFGRATPSKYQPDSNGVTTKPEGDPGKSNDTPY